MNFSTQWNKLRKSGNFKTSDKKRMIYKFDYKVVATVKNKT